ncbi:hypothetical protein G6F68_010100 [Rhizopus microsporus]|nr:hypothetical protein G6F68_010100 [Rhizopus microsporus]
MRQAAAFMLRCAGIRWRSRPTPASGEHGLVEEACALLSDRRQENADLAHPSENGARGASARAPGSARASTSTKSTRMPSRSAAKVSSTQPAKWPAQAEVQVRYAPAGVSFRWVPTLVGTLSSSRQRRLDGLAHPRIVGRPVRGEARAHLAVAAAPARLEVPPHRRCRMDRDFLAGQALAQRAFTDRLRLRGGQLLVQRVGVLTGHADLGEHREADIVGELAELLDLGIAARFLAEEVVGGEAQHFQALRVLFRIQRLQAFVLRGQAALGGDVDQQQRTALELRQRLRLAIEVTEAEIVGGGHDGGPWR